MVKKHTATPHYPNLVRSLVRLRSVLSCRCAPAGAPAPTVRWSSVLPPTFSQHRPGGIVTVRLTTRPSPERSSNTIHGRSGIYTSHLPEHPVALNLDFLRRALRPDPGSRPCPSAACVPGPAGPADRVAAAPSAAPRASSQIARAERTRDRDGQ